MPIFYVALISSVIGPNPALETPFLCIEMVANSKLVACTETAAS